MRRLTSSEKLGLVLGLIFVIGGCYMMTRPTDMVIYHPGSGRYNNLGGNPWDTVSKGKCRVYGVVTLAVGVGISSLALHPLRH